MPKTFIVKVTTVHDRAYRVVAESEDEARELVDSGVADVEAIDSSSHFAYQLDSDDWPCYEEKK